MCIQVCIRDFFFFDLAILSTCFFLQLYVCFIAFNDSGLTLKKLYSLNLTIWLLFYNGLNKQVWNTINVNNYIDIRVNSKLGRRLILSAITLLSGYPFNSDVLFYRANHMTKLIPMLAWHLFVIMIKNCSDSIVQWATCFTGWHLKAIKNRHGTLFWPLNSPAETLTKCESTCLDLRWF